MTEQQELLRLGKEYGEWATYYPKSAIRRRLRRYGVHGKRSLRAALRQFDAWRAPRPGGFVPYALRITNRTFDRVSESRG